MISTRQIRTRDLPAFSVCDTTDATEPLGRYYIHIRIGYDTVFVPLPPNLTSLSQP